MPDTIENTSFKHIIVDNKYIASITIKKLPEYIYFLDFIKELPKNVNYSCSLYITKLDPIKAINDITFSIGNTNGEIETISSNQRNIDVVLKAKEEANILRRKIQIENQEIYCLKIILTFYSLNPKELYKNLLETKSTFYSKGIISEITNFRHLNYYLNNIPLFLNKNTSNKLYVTTDSLSNLFPFYIENIVDENGIIIGKNEENRLCLLDIFSNKYENSNMCVFGCSGAGKSFFTKLFILRNYYHGIKQIIFDVENEYDAISQRLNGVNLGQNQYINILEITKKDIENAAIEGQNYLEYKIDKILNFLSNYINISKAKLREYIKVTYSKYGITNDINTIKLIKEKDNIYLSPKLINSNKYPTLKDIKVDEEYRAQYEKCIQNELKYFSKITNIEISNPLIVIKMDELIQYPQIVVDLLKNIMNYIGDTKTIVYIDEVWKYSKSENILLEIFNMYKTIRKRNGAIVTITQDVADYFEYKDGKYAKSILNNSCFKMIFKTDPKELNNIIINKESNNNVVFLNKGEAMLFVGNNNLKIKIQANDFERGIIYANDNSSR